MSQDVSSKKTNRSASVSLKLLAGLVFVLFSSCLPSNANQSSGQSPSPRKSSTSGENSGAYNGSSNQNSTTGNSTWTPSNGSGGNAVVNNNTNGSNAVINNNSGNSTNSGTTNNNTITNTSSDCYKGDEFICKVERLIGEKTNKYRQGRGLQPLTLDSKIAFVARDWSQKQARSGSISHSGFPSARQAVYRQEFHVSRSLHGENVAMTGRVGGSGRDDAAAERVAEEFAVMWWNSSGHRANMLGSFKNLGVGVYQTSGGSWYATQCFE